MSESTETTTESNPFTKPGFIIAAILVLALIAGAFVIFLLPKGENTADPAPAPAGTTAAANPSSSAAPSVKESVCGLPSSKDTALGTAPKSTWELVGTIAAPTDPRIGPGKTEASGFRYCFANTPTGALYAAVNMASLGSINKPEVLAQFADKLLVPGTGRDAAMKEASAPRNTAASNSTSIQVKGFLIKSYSPTEASVDLAFATQTGEYAQLNFPLRWVDGDWKAKPSDDGTPYGTISQIRDLSGFILWSGV